MGGLLRRLKCSNSQQQPGTTAPPESAAGPRSLSRLLGFVVSHAQLFQVLLVAAGLLGLCAVPLLERRIDFDENALLAGSARPTISLSPSSPYASGIAFADALQPTYFSSHFTAALQAALQAEGWAVSNHTFTVDNCPTTSSSRGSSGSSGGSSVFCSCTNVHTVVPSPRGDGKEALVLVTAVNHQAFSTDYHQAESGVRLSLALGQSLLSHLSASPWLAKELIWLIPDASCGLMEAVGAWTHAYQLTPLLQQSSLPHFHRSGVLQQALLLELPGGSFNRLQVSLEGYGGQLPKLDMFWLLRWYSQAYVTAPVELPQLQTDLSPPFKALQHTLLPLLPLLTAAGSSGSNAESALHNHLLKLQVMVQFMGRQARGLPTGAHAAFKGLGVDAATLRVLTKDDSSGSVIGPGGFTGAGNIPETAAAEEAADPQTSQTTAGQAEAAAAAAAAAADAAYATTVGFDPALHQLGNVLESALRSCSVLIERFHHSLFLYVLTGLGSYVSVERYIGPLVALICVMVLQAAYIVREPKPHKAAAAAAAATTTHQAAAATALPPPAPGSSTADWTQQQQQQQQQGDSAAAGGRGNSSSENDNSGSSGSSGMTPELQQVLELHRLQLPPCQARYAAQRHEWVAALQLVALIHAAALAAAHLLRTAPWHELLPLLPGGSSSSGSSTQSLQLLLVRLSAAAATPGQHLQEIGVGLGLLLSLLMACEGLLTASSHTSSSGSSNGSSSGSSRVCLWKVLVVELSLAAAAMAAVACINWALGYATCLVLTPLALTCSRRQSNSSVASIPANSGRSSSNGSSNGSTTPGSSSRHRAAVLLLRLLVVLCCSPPALLLLLSAVSPGVGVAGALQADWLWWLVRGSSWGTYMVAAGVYLPFWTLAAWSAVVSS